MQELVSVNIPNHVEVIVYLPRVSSKVVRLGGVGSQRWAPLCHELGGGVRRAPTSQYQAAPA